MSLSTLVLTLLAAAPLSAPAADLELPPGSVAARFWGAETWTEQLERDAALSFGNTSTEKARARLSEQDLVGVERAATLLAVGAGGDVSARPLLRTFARESASTVRQGAILGLGELGPGDESFLNELVGESDEGVARAALVALVLTGSDKGRRLVQDVARGSDADRSEWARDALGFGDRPAAGPYSGADAYLELRWHAARRYGYVEGQSWETRLVEGLCSSEEFLDGVVLQEAVRLVTPGIRDHLMQQLIAVGGRAAARSVARTMQADLARTVRFRLWLPRDEAEWSVLFEEIERGKSHPDIVALLRTALDIPSYRVRALALLVGTGDAKAGGDALTLMPTFEPKVKAQLVRGFGATGDPKWIPELSRLRLDESSEVHTEALIAQVRLRHTPARERLLAILRNHDDPDRPAAIAILADMGWNLQMHPLITEALRSAVDFEEQLTLATVLVEQGVFAPRDLVRQALAAGVAGDRAAAMVRGLAINPSPEDLNWMREVFPAEGSLELNIELARALLRNNDNGILPVLRAALWSDPWHRSLLAAALDISIRGIHGLRGELDAAPADSGGKATRRVGFALGEFGGFGEVDLLSRRRRSGDPALQGAYLGALSARTH